MVLQGPALSFNFDEEEEGEGSEEESTTELQQKRKRLGWFSGTSSYLKYFGDVIVSVLNLILP